MCDGSISSPSASDGTASNIASHTSGPKAMLVPSIVFTSIIGQFSMAILMPRLSAASQKREKTSRNGLMFFSTGIAWLRPAKVATTPIPMRSARSSTFRK